MSARTPGLLFVAETAQDDGGSPETVIRGAGGAAGVAVAIDFGANNPGMREANAKRLVACWNALDGLPDDALDGGWNVRSMSAYAKGLEVKLAAARLLLTEAMTSYADIMDDRQDDLLFRLRALLKGGAA